MYELPWDRAVIIHTLQMLPKKAAFRFHSLHISDILPLRTCVIFVIFSSSLLSNLLYLLYLNDCVFWFLTGSQTLNEVLFGLHKEAVYNAWWTAVWDRHHNH